LMRSNACEWPRITRLRSTLSKRSCPRWVAQSVDGCVTETGTPSACASASRHGVYRAAPGSASAILSRATSARCMPHPMHFSTQELLGTSRNALVMVVLAYFLDRPGFRQLRFSIVANRAMHALSRAESLITSTMCVYGSILPVTSHIVPSPSRDR